MMVEPSLISHPAVPSHLSVTWPLFGLLGRSWAAAAQNTDAANASGASADFNIERPPRGETRAESSDPSRQRQRNTRGGIRSRPSFGHHLVKGGSVKRGLRARARSPEQAALRRETAPLPSSQLARLWRNCRRTRLGQFRRSSRSRQTSDVSQ